MERKVRRTRTPLDDPLQRRAVQKSSNEDGYQPSFGRPRNNSKRYMKELEEQIADQKRRKAQEEKDKETDWWEKRKPLVTEFKVPHPNQVFY